MSETLPIYHKPSPFPKRKKLDFNFFFLPEYSGRAQNQLIPNSMKSKANAKVVYEMFCSSESYYEG